MQVDLYALCWNDADMLPFFFRHYDPLVSRYFIFDDHSSDGSLDLMRAHPNVEVESFVRSDPDSFTLSELSMSNECWKRSRGSADWVIVIDIDEHLFHPDLTEVLMRYKTLGITIVPALGYQMISEKFPRPDARLCEAHPCGAPWNIYSKVALFDPSAITEINYDAGRHHASPMGRVIAPANDELLLLHYKFLGLTRTHARHQQQRGGLRSKDLESGWGYQYCWSEAELRNAWRECARNAIDIHSDAAVVNYPIPRWWDAFRSLATQPCTRPLDNDYPLNKKPVQGENPVTGQVLGEVVAAGISPVSFWVPDYVCPSAWIEHAPFAFWICEQLRPRRIVELGTHYGYSYFAFCQAIDRLRLGATAYAVDTWKGDEHAGFYDESVFQSVVARNSEKYSAFSSLIRSTFQDALQYFNEGSVDLLHIDGRHFYDDVERDFMLWRPKLTEDAVVLLHDTNTREREFGVWKFFEKVAAQHPSFQFFHGYGLGVLVPGDRVPAPLAPLIKASRETAHEIRAAYAALGGALTVRAALGRRHHEIEAMNTGHARSLDEIEGLKALIATIVNERDEAVAALAAGREALASSRALLAETEQSTGVLQATLAERDGALAAISQRANEFFAALQSAEAKLAKREEDLSRAKRELSARNTAAAALQSEIIRLRNALAAARDVGRAALAALRTEPAMVSGAPRTDGRLALMRRSLGFRGRDQ